MKKVLQTNAAPAAIGPYSQGIEADHYVFVSGQLPLNPATGVMPEGIEAQTAQSLENVQAVLQAAGADLKNVIKTNVFLTDINDFAIVNSVYATFFKENPPARSAVQVVALPKGANIEIEVIAIQE
ncbi:endoribonuclease L-PSP [Desulfitobacterium dichloroeliminans LMG P-21439]|uniref:Endoribonuclease L-PSP n=1 Tax=Desulfitobacterium dichloroeliminans (strain LMG P-21439 / DCA1) TaxID=871963 RepID=L0F3J5_DESDL|nr:RidA family protein [Desulfitobacterium dichloroeliminans]AGA67752.1 endoribonuclease L-PSP [Desulfitobacterium dichloroeliminans LMG P-21439]